MAKDYMALFLMKTEAEGSDLHWSRASPNNNFRKPFALSTRVLDTSTQDRPGDIQILSGRPKTDRFETPSIGCTVPGGGCESVVISSSQRI